MDSFVVLVSNDNAGMATYFNSPYTISLPPKKRKVAREWEKKSEGEVPLNSSSDFRFVSGIRRDVNTPSNLLLAFVLTSVEST
jgi:hypothetical protein